MKGLMLNDLYVARRTAGLMIGLILFMVVLGLVLALNDAVLPMELSVVYATMSVWYVMADEEKAGWDQYIDTLPVTRRTVVTVKYLTAIIPWGGTLLILLVSQYLRLRLTGGDLRMLLRLLSMIAAFGLLYPAVMLPCVFRFGAQKGRLVNLIVAVLLLLTSYGMLTETSSGLRAQSLEPHIYAALPASLVLFALSWLLSVRLYEKREL